MKKTFALCFALAMLYAGVAFAASRGETLRVGVSIDAKNFDPQNAVDTYSFSMQKQIYEPLFTVDGKTRKLTPVLAEKVEVLDDHTYKFYLRKGVKFHNGEEFTADDVVFSLTRVTDPKSSVFAKSKGVWIDPKSFEVIDKHTVIVRTNGPIGGWLGFNSRPCEGATVAVIIPQNHMRFGDLCGDRRQNADHPVPFVGLSQKNVAISIYYLDRGPPHAIEPASGSRSPGQQPHGKFGSPGSSAQGFSLIKAASPASENQRPFRIVGWFGTYMLDFATPGCPQEVKAQAVFVLVHLTYQCGAQSCPLGWRQAAFKDRVLHPLAPTAALPGNTAESPPAGRIFRIDVVTDQNQHHSPDDIGRISVQLATNAAGQKPGLHMPEQAQGHALVEKGMQHLVPFTFLVGHQRLLASLLPEQHRARCRMLEIPGPELAPVEQGERQPVGQHGPKFLHHVQGQTGPAGSQAMQKAHLWVQTNPFQCAAQIIDQKCVKKGQQAIHLVLRRPSVTTGKADSLHLRREQPVEHVKIDRTSLW